MQWHGWWRLLRQAAARFEYFALLKSLIADSLTRGGSRAEQRYYSADSGSSRLLAPLRVIADSVPPGALHCPGSSGVDGTRMEPPVGYYLQFTSELTRDRAGWVVQLSKSCTFIYRGQAGGFVEGASWEIRRVGGLWRIVRTLQHFVT